MPLEAAKREEAGATHDAQNTQLTTFDNATVVPPV
jgi:hypothetical protein